MTLEKDLNHTEEAVFNQYLPKTVTGVTEGGREVTFPVLAWDNTDRYKSGAPVGSYRYTAVINTEVGGKTYVSNQNVKPYVRVAITNYHIRFKQSLPNGVYITAYETQDNSYVVFVINNTTDKTYKLDTKMIDNGNTIECTAFLYPGLKMFEAGHINKDYKWFEVSSIKAVDMDRIYDNDISYKYEILGNKVYFTVANNSNCQLSPVIGLVLLFDKYGKLINLPESCEINIKNPGTTTTLPYSFSSSNPPTSCELILFKTINRSK